MIDIVDLGCKEGGALDYFVRRGGFQVSPANCLAVDIREKYKDVVTSKGYQFLHDDFTRRDFPFPSAKIYLAFHVLEHLDSVAKAQEALNRMMTAAQRLVVVRIPSVEDPLLTKHKLKFAWETWLGHKNRVKHSDLTRPTVRPQRIGVCAVGFIASSTDSRIVPIDAPAETSGYDPKTMKPKPEIDLNVCYEWEVRFELH